MSKSYIGWPVRLIPILNTPDAHITLKYLGGLDVDAEDIALRLEGRQVSFPITDQMTWHGGVFAEDAHVMILYGWSDRLLDTRRAVEDLRQDDYTWRPHITLPVPTWANVCQNGISPWKVIESVGPLTLFTDGEPVAVFDENERDPVLFRRRYAPA